MRCRIVVWALASSLAVAGAQAQEVANADAEPSDERVGLRIELGALVGYSERQIEGSGQDDVVSRDIEATVSLAILHPVWRGLGAGLFADFDHTIERDVDGPEEDAAMELSLGVLLRYTFLDTLWVQGGYMFFMRRWDGARDDLPNRDGETTGAFEGSYNSAWLFGAGVQLPIREGLHVFLKLEYRIRYFTRRKGTALAGNRMFGGQTIAPYLGLAYTF